MEKCMRRIFWTLLAVAAMAPLTGCGSALIRAAQTGDVSAMEKLLDQGANINESAQGATTIAGPPLSHAAYYCQPEAIRYLVSRGADVEATNGKFGYRPLHLAVAGGCIEAVKILLDAGADIDTKTNTMHGSALAIAAMSGDVKILKYLISRGADVDDAVTTVLRSPLGWDGHTEGLALLEKYARPVATAAASTTHPAAAVVRSDVDMVPYLKATSRPDAYAVVIGIEQYRQNLPQADFAVQDASLVARYLEKVLGYPGENIVTLINDRALQSDFFKYFEKWLPNNVEPGGTVFVYFSGHGAPNPKTGDAYLVPYDGDPTFIAETGYSLSRMYAALGKLPAKEIIVALDSCFSGAGGRSVLAKGARPLVMNLQTETALSKNMTVLSASAGDQISSTYNEKGHGLFTYFMLKGIKNEDVLNPDGSLHMEDLYGYLKPQVERIARKQYNNEQTPQLMEGR